MTATTIRLYGKMGKEFGRVHRVHLDSNTPAEAVRYLCSQFPRARAYLMNAKDQGVGFAVFRGKENIGKDDLKTPSGNDDIRIAPVLLGSKNGGVLNIILGVVIIAIAYINPFGYLTGPMVSAMYAAGASMIIGGVVQLLTPAPKGARGRDAADNAPSYVFNGAVNTQAQGNPVPILYGRMIVGSAVISAGLSAGDYAPATAGVSHGTPGYNPGSPYG